MIAVDLSVIVVNYWRHTHFRLRYARLLCADIREDYQSNECRYTSEGFRFLRRLNDRPSRAL